MSNFHDQIKVLLIHSDNDAWIKDAVLCLKSSKLDYKVIAETAELFDILTIEKPDVILIEPSLYKIQVIDFIEKIRAELPNIRTIIISNENNYKETVEILQAGGSVWVPEKKIQYDLLGSIKRVLEPMGWKDNDLNSDIVLGDKSIIAGEESPEGVIIDKCMVPWFFFARRLINEADFLYKIPWRRLEELVASAYVRDGWETVILTPGSGDGGRDVIAIRTGNSGEKSIRIVEQVKAYNTSRKVKADDVRALIGILYADHNVTKGFVTTTSDFAPGIKKDKSITPFVPHRLAFRNNKELIKWFCKYLV